MEMAELYPAPGHQPRERFQRDNDYAKVKALEELPDNIQDDLLHTYEQLRKKRLWAYIFWLIIPGFHSFYLGKVKRGLLFIASLLLPVIWFFWWVIDAIKMQDLISEVNGDLADRLLRAAQVRAGGQA